MESLEPGTVVDRFRISEMIGAGAMGEVYLAVDEGLNRKVALKILLDAHRQNPELRARFVREARAVAAIQHPNVVQVFTTGDYDGRPFLAMEYLAGQDLGSIVRDVGPLDSLAAVSAVLDAARGLEAASRAGLIHRDVKPSNLVRLDAGGVKVTDFGLAKPVERGSDPALTAMGVVVGTPDYIAPEQARGDDIDSRVDVYALGCTLYYLLVGRPPFRKGIDAEDKYLKVVARHLRDPAPDARDKRPEVDDELAELAKQMMSKSPDDRPTYQQLIERLDRIRGRLIAAPSPSTTATAASIISPPRGFDASSESSVTAVRLPASESLGGAPPPRIGKLLWGITVVCALVFLGGLGAYLFARRPAAAPVATPDAGVVVRPVDAGVVVPPPRDPVPPGGMILVRDAAGKPAFFVDRRPVTHAEYGALIRSHRFKKALADKPVTGIAWDYAVSFARLKGKRLLTAAEWPLALAAEGFAPAGMKTWEWIDDGSAGNKGRPVRRAPDGAAFKPARGDATVSFRLAQDLP